MQGISHTTAIYISMKQELVSITRCGHDHVDHVFVHAACVFTQMRTKPAYK